MSDKDRRREERQKELVAIAKRLLVDEGLPGLTIDGVAKLSKYSRPTVHQHFGGAAGLLDAVAACMMEQTAALAEAATRGSDAPPRDRALTCVLAYELLARFHADDFHILEYLGYPWVLKKLPQELRGQHLLAVTEFSQQLGGHIQAAIDDGSLKLAAGNTVTNLTFHSIAMVYGSYTSIIKNRVIFRLSESEDSWRCVREALDAFWDGSGWAPKSTDVDYLARAEEILKDAFPTYWLKKRTAELERELDDQKGEEDDAEPGDEDDAKDDSDVDTKE